MPCMPNGIYADSLEFVMRKQDEEDMWTSEDESPKVVGNIIFNIKPIWYEGLLI